MESNKVSPESENKKNSLLKEALQWVLAIGIAVVLAFLIRGFVFEQALVMGDSMQDTLFDKQRLIVYKTGYFFHPPERGDIIILEYQKGSFKFLPVPDPNEIDYIKRVIGLPGDVVDIKDGSVYVNGEKLDEPYAKGRTEPYGMEFPITIPENKVFVLGDNRENSSDSRQIGLIDFDRIKGKAVFRIYPLKDFGTIY
ncbi:signal peptidase I [Clostridium thermosuccinogenes]|uniref:Signal peptidase I n=1 Tax=Clostridium thermosuccinogenes TaxID=84032 RepID=A0A2K2FG43_9CLOT|nr:signal peptidase I [Pseudoclostridium thermosuccinogenes]AUS98739.1 signal peptidase I [Pseudoclostridium thermosuccinogenes]PNT94390.1 signal peptidase I [Pseudoclostridium thermosuccinogenes]PNT97755.1 signal peptidase I [Pseudoclostridium thermosuccinogenes]PNT99794.1 signal peptidase I [Pseudoclostridium thermosuccinogenes]